MKKYYILDNVIDRTENFKIYNNLVNTPMWSLNRCSSDTNNLESSINNFPGMIVEQDSQSFNPYLSGYFQSLTSIVKNVFQNQYNFNLPNNISRIHLGAKNDKSETLFHPDVEDSLSWTILGFLTPVWKAEYGGHINIEGEEIEYIPGRFIIFKSNILHNGGFVNNNNLDYWRISLNIILK
jgi:hypothetical protein|tara:strand:- start:597 stop:1139 length:543 start_codon:yes stop_codon:yes gene_type:complete